MNVDHGRPLLRDLISIKKRIFCLFNLTYPIGVSGDERWQSGGRVELYLTDGIGTV